MSLPENLVSIDPLFVCPQCQGNTVYTGTKKCYLCANGAGELGLYDKLSDFGGSKVRSVAASPRDMAAAKVKVDPNLPKLE